MLTHSPTFSSDLVLWNSTLFIGISTVLKVVQLCSWQKKYFSWNAI